MTTAALVPCEGCRRHIRASEPSCPFCSAPLSATAGQGIVPEPGQRLSRAGVLAFAAAFLSTACHPQASPTPPDPIAADSGVMATIYGGPPDPGPPPPVPAPAPPTPNDMAVPAYGGPPPMLPTPPPSPTPTPPAVRPPAHHSDRQHHPVPAYGIAPSPPRPNPGGSMSTRYGSPPRPDDSDG